MSLNTYCRQGEQLELTAKCLNLTCCLRLVQPIAERLLQGVFGITRSLLSSDMRAIRHGDQYPYCSESCSAKGTMTVSNKIL